MGMLKDSDKEVIKKELSGLTKPVRIINFTQENECNYCRETTEILSEVAELSDKISVEIYDFVSDKEIVDKYKIDKIPATAIVGDIDNGIRFYGIPSGYEFISLLDSIKMVSAGSSGLDERSRKALGNLKKPIHLQVFVTPT